MIERDNKVRIAYSVIIGLFKRECLGWTAVDLMAWANRNVPDLFLEPITRSQAQYILDHPNEIA
jgi:hypothetical protein